MLSAQVHLGKIPAVAVGLQLLSTSEGARVVRRTCAPDPSSRPGLSTHHGAPCRCDSDRGITDPWLVDGPGRCLARINRQAGPHSHPSIGKTARRS
jgi:hypothetical protein